MEMMMSGRAAERQTDLESIRGHLRAWANYVSQWAPKLGLPKRVPFVSLMKPSLVHDGDGSDGYSSSDLWAFGLIDGSVESLPSMYRMAIYARYFDEARPSDAADMAEERLIPIVKRKGLIL